MKCIRCQHDSKYRERKGRTCPNCGGKFAFEPREGDRLTDKAFQRAIELVSAEGRVRWGVEHLYYEVCRRKRLPPGMVPGLFLAAGLLLLFGVVFGVSAHRLWFVGVLAGLAGLALGLVAFLLRSGSPFVRVDEETFREMYRRWTEVHGTPAGVIVRMSQPSPPRQMEPDLADYSFDRAVICDRARTVDLLLVNNFHFENNCAVLSIEGYPPGPFETVRAMLKRNPKLAVYTLHDATPKGCRLAHQLATDPAWFATQVKVIDVGLRPIHGARFRGLLQRSKSPSVPAQDGITAWEAAWLGTYSLALAAIRPEQVLKRLFKAINLPINPADYPEAVIYLPAREAAAGTGGGNGGDGGGGMLAADAGDVDGPADSFG
jgi:hypothetical protein